MRGLKEQDAAFSILSCLIGLAQDKAYTEFREKFLARKNVVEKEHTDLLRLHSQAVRQLETRLANLLKAVEDGDYSAPIVAQLNMLDVDLTQARANRDAAAPKPITLPQDLPALYRGACR
ncbi:hypothetical protein [uncultured Pelagimonas sp.]|uniref:hypothetical protein n=1 Tax=uncultured Pelagimonas sp. TaxID=1618102 RepID=UPI00262E71AB|nr:hypothetical protein [uncultured Pelagimonas sp.]